MLKVSEILGPGAKKRLSFQLGSKGEERLEKRVNYLLQKEDLQLKGVYTLGLQGAVLRVKYKERLAVLKVCALDNIFSGQDAALRGAPKGSVPFVYKSFPEEEAWLLEDLLGSPGRSGLFDFSLAKPVLTSFQKGSLQEGLFPLLSYYLNIARYINCSSVLKQEDCLLDLNEGLEKRLVHGDPTPENIIFSPGKGYTLIDPTGLVGDPAFDWAVLALYSKNPLASLEKASFIYPAWRIYLWAWIRGELSLRQSQEEGLVREVTLLEPLLHALRAKLKENKKVPMSFLW